MHSADDEHSARIGLVLLAAGGSSRLGSPKQLVLFRGRSLLRYSAESAVASGASPIAVVLGSRAAEMSRELDGLALDVIRNDSWENGMSSSIHAGISAIESQDISAAILMLCDQPHVTAETLRKLMTAFVESGKSAIVSEYDDGAIGPPCVFARALFPNLLGLRGPQGAKQVLRGLSENDIAHFRFDLGRVDIDTAADVERLGG